MFVSDLAPLVVLSSELGDFVAGFDPRALQASDAPRLVELATQIERYGHALKLDAATVIDDANTWRGSGDRSKEEWLARTTGTTVGEAAGVFETSAALTELPAVADAVRSGNLSAAQARAIADAAAVSPGSQARLLDAARRQSVRDLNDLCKKTKAAADPDPEATNARIHAARSATKRDEADGSATITLTGTPDQIGRMWAAAERRAEQVFKQAYREGRREPEQAYRFDAFRELLTSGARDDGPAMPVGADAKIVYLLDWDAHVRGRAEGDERSELLGQGPVPVSVIHEAAKHAFITAVVTDGEDVRLVAHLGRHATARQATALQAMVPTCVVQGCDKRTRLEVHHLLDWSRTELTVLDFLEHGCSHHHDLLTNHGYTLGDHDQHRERPLIPPPPQRAGAPPPSPGRYGIDQAMVDQIRAHIDTLNEQRRRAS